MSAARPPDDDFPLLLPTNTAVEMPAPAPEPNELGERYSNTLALLKQNSLTQTLKACLAPAQEMKEWKIFANDFKALGDSIHETLEQNKFLAKESDIAKKISSHVSHQLGTQLSPKADAKSLHPLEKEIVCVSFVVAHLKEKSAIKKYCFLSLSGAGTAMDYQKALAVIKEFIAKNKEHDGYTLKIIPAVSPRFHAFMEATAKEIGMPFDKNRLCAEIAFHSAIAKFFYYFGSAFTIEGIANVPLSVYLPTSQKKPVDLSKKSPSAAWDAGSPWLSQSGQSIHHWECCDYCKRNKPMYLLIWKTMQTLGDQVKSQKKSPKKIFYSPTSPISVNLLDGFPAELLELFTEIEECKKNMMKENIIIGKKLKQIDLGQDPKSSLIKMQGLKARATHIQHDLKQVLQKLSLQVKDQYQLSLVKTFDDEIKMNQAHLDWLDHHIAKVKPKVELIKKTDAAEKRKAKTADEKAKETARPPVAFATQLKKCQAEFKMITTRHALHQFIPRVEKLREDLSLSKEVNALLEEIQKKDAALKKEGELKKLAKKTGSLSSHLPGTFFGASGKKPPIKADASKASAAPGVTPPKHD